MELEKMKTGIIEYMSGYYMDEEVKIPVWRKEEVSTESVKMYLDAILVTHKLDPCSRLLLDWLLFNKTIRGVISTDVYQRERFAKFCATIGVAYADVSVRRAFGLLAEHGLLIKLSRSAYLLNPRYFYSGSEADRWESLKRQARINKEINKDKGDLTKSI